MSKFKKTSILLSGLLVVFLFSALNLSAQNKKNTTIKASIQDSIDALEKLQMDLIKNEKSLRLLLAQNDSLDLRLRDSKLKEDSLVISKEREVLFKAYNEIEYQSKYLFQRISSLLGYIKREYFKPSNWE